MAVFFFVVGLELKREILVGELADPKQAMFPIIAAIGGMVVPVLIYVSINPSGHTLDGWGVPMATDIAFALGVLALLGKRAPKNLLTFLVALAIVDDLGAVTVIALFYTETINIQALMVVVIMMGLLVALNLGGDSSSFALYTVWCGALDSHAEEWCPCNPRRHLFGVHYPHAPEV